MSAYPAERCDSHPRQSQPSHERYWSHTVCIGVLPQKNTPSRLKLVTVSPNSREQNEKQILLHQKFICIWNNSYRTHSEHWQKTSGFQKGKSINSGQKIKMKKDKGFQDGDLHPRKGVVKEEKLPHTHTQGQEGALEPRKGMQQQVPGGKNGEKAPQRSLFNSTSQPRNSLHGHACLREWGLGTEAQACGVGPQGEYWV